VPIRFRKSLTLVPGLARLNLNRRSVSVTVGLLGLRRTYSTTGTVTTSADLPAPWYWREHAAGGSG
jgi:hypothetical protein